MPRATPRHIPPLTAALALAVLLALPGIAAAAPADAVSGEPAWSAPSVEAPSAQTFGDLDGYTWAKQSINYVALNRLWMRDFGTDTFRPKLPETRELFARAIVRAFGVQDEAVDPAITFSDLPSEDPFFRFANLAVKHDWMATKSGEFLPQDPVTLVQVYRALVRVLPLEAAEAALEDLHSEDGYRFAHLPNFATTELGMRLGLRYNHGNERDDLLPSDPMPRSEVAYALWRAAIVPDATVDGLSAYETIELPALSAKVRKVVEFGVRYAGYAYIWGGEWEAKRPGQLQGGFDCSGLMWWTMKAPAPGFDNTSVRGYRGWKLPQRTSADMAATGKRLKYSALRPGDLMFFDGNSDGTIDHVDLYIGNGWSLDSSSGVGGVTILNVRSGWYHDHFKWGRRIT